jgi:hypothetical protein
MCAVEKEPFKQCPSTIVGNIEFKKIGVLDLQNSEQKFLTSWMTGSGKLRTNWQHQEVLRCHAATRMQ